MRRTHKLIEILKKDRLPYSEVIYFAKNGNWYTTTQIIEMIEKDNYIFEIQNRSTISTYLIIKTRKDGSKYLTTQKDQTTRNNLVKTKKKV